MMKKLYLPFAVLVCGAAVLAIEMLGTRIIGPYYGVSLYLWSALISVTLLALSVGYFLGGRMADRDPVFRRFGMLIALAGAWMLAIPWIARPVLLLCDPLGLRTAVLLSSFLLFTPPLALLGALSPMAIRLRTAQIDTVGRTAGGLYAVSTIGSVVAALVTGFFLIPTIGVRWLTLSVGIILIATALPALSAGGRGSRFFSGPLLFILLGSLAVAFGSSDPVAGRPGIVAVRQSPYGELRVIDFAEKRHLTIDGGIHSIVDTASHKTYMQYAAAMELLKLFFDAPGSMLVLGLGGGSIPVSFSADGWSVDVVELDPAVTELAREYFGFRSDAARVHHMDARTYLRMTDKRYDLIVLDAYGSGAFPFQLVSSEFFELVRSHLAADGMLGVNIDSRGWRNRLVFSLAATLRTRFPHSIALPVTEPPDAVGNVLLFASSRPIEFPEDRLRNPFESIMDDFLHWRSVQMNHAWNNRFAPDSTKGMVITDDHNPVDLWSEAMRLPMRAGVHKYFGEQRLNW